MMIEASDKTRDGWVTCEEVQIDHEHYQRPTNRTWIRELAHELDPDLFGVVHISERADGTLWVIDGQHRILAVLYLAERDDSWRGQKVRAIIYSGLSIQREAYLFKKLNNARAQRPVEKFLSGLCAETEPEVSISRIVNHVGLKVGRNTNASTISCVGTLARIYNGYRSRVAKGSTHPHALRLTLEVAIEAWGANPQSLSGELLLGLGLVVLAYYRQIDREVLRKRLAMYPGGPGGVLRDAKGLATIKKERLYDAVAALIIGHYNKVKRTKQLGQLRNGG